jgi:Mrp family chromosome partitioning ATPase
VSILALDYINNNIETSEQITSIVPVPVLEINKKSSMLGSLFNGRQQRAERSQKYQMIGMRLLYATNDTARKLVLVGPADNNGDASVVAAQLALFLARSGKRVILVDANPEHHSIGQLFHLGNRPGLGDFISGISKRIVPVMPLERLPNLGVLPYGPNHQFDSSFIATPPVLAQIDQLSERAEVVVMSSPALQRPDALMFASHAMGSILVITRGQTSQKGLQDIASSLSMVGGRILAAVLKPEGMANESLDLGDKNKGPMNPMPAGPQDGPNSGETTEPVIWTEPKR